MAGPWVSASRLLATWQRARDRLVSGMRLLLPQVPFVTPQGTGFVFPGVTAFGRPSSEVGERPGEPHQQFVLHGRCPAKAHPNPSFSVDRAGRDHVWQIEPARLDEMRRWLDHIEGQWGEALSRLKAFLER